MGPITKSWARFLKKKNLFAFQAISAKLTTWTVVDGLGNVVKLGQLYNIAEQTNHEFFINNLHNFTEFINYGLCSQFCGNRSCI